MFVCVCVCWCVLVRVGACWCVFVGALACVPACVHQRKPRACSHPTSLWLLITCVCVYMCAYSSQSSSDDDTVSSVSQERVSRGRRDSVVSCRDWAVQNHTQSQ